MTQLVYTDVETTGLDPRRHDAYELSWAVDSGPIHTVILPHTLRHADPEALTIGRYHERDIPRRRREQVAAERRAAGHPTVADFVAAFTAPYGGKNTLVCANPHFDAGMLFGKVVARESWSSRARRALWLPAPPAPAEPWAYRLLDIEAYAAGVLGWEKPLGLRTIRNCLAVDLGVTGIPAPDHTAAGDVETLRACHRALQEITRLRNISQVKP